jgi:hypothetical protein
MLNQTVPNMNKGTAPPLGRGGCALKKMVPFLSGADGEGRRHFKLAPCLTSLEPSLIFPDGNLPQRRVQDNPVPTAIDRRFGMRWGVVLVGDESLWRPGRAYWEL